MHKSGRRMVEAELYRLKGELTLAQSSVQSLASPATLVDQSSRGLKRRFALDDAYLEDLAVCLCPTLKRRAHRNKAR